MKPISISKAIYRYALKESASQFKDGLISEDEYLHQIAIAKEKYRRQNVSKNKSQK